MPEEMLRLKAVVKLTATHRATIYRWVNAGHFPRFVKLSPRVTAWRSSDIAKWQQDRAAASAA